jgi:hypothetical protein
LFENKLELFIAKRVLLVFMILSIISLVILEKRWLVFFGLFTSSAYSVLKFSMTYSLFYKVLSPVEDVRITGLIIVKYITAQFITVILLAASLWINIWLFAGIVAGVMIIPAIILINGITEALGITHNSYGK